MCQLTVDRVEMTGFKIYTPIEVRYSDLDPQWHVNHARILTFIEQARFNYLLNLGLFNGNNFLQLSLIVADVHVAYKAPILPGEPVRVGTRISRIGNKSLVFEDQVENSQTGQIFAISETTMVAYDYVNQTSTPVSVGWRRIISSFEGQEF
jgi:acyl-CoA thioester hydrolase